MLTLAKTASKQNVEEFKRHFQNTQLVQNESINHCKTKQNTHSIKCNKIQIS